MTPLVWLLSLLASIPAIAEDDRAVHFPPLYDSFIPPTLSGSYTDPVFGVSIKRLSDAPNTNNNAGSGPLSFVSTDSRDGDHFVFAADEISTPSTIGLRDRYVFVCQISTNTKGAVLEL